MSLPQQSYLINLLTRTYIAAHTDSGSFHKGSKIDSTAISGHTVTDKSIKAFVQGSAIHPYEVHIKLVEGTPITYCTCPVQHQWCKHCVAVGLRSIALFQASEDRFLENFVDTASPSEIVSAFRKIFQWEPQVQLPLQLHVLAHTGTTVSISEFLEDHLGKAIGSFLPPRWTESSPPSGAGAHSSLNAGVGKREQTARFEEMMVIFRHFLDHGHTELMLPYLEEFIKQLASNRTLSLAGSKAAKNTLNDALALHLSAAKAVVSSANASAGAEIARWITWTYFFQRRYYATSAHLRCRESTGAGGHRLLREFRVLGRRLLRQRPPASVAVPARRHRDRSTGASECDYVVRSKFGLATTQQR